MGKRRETELANDQFSKCFPQPGTAKEITELGREEKGEEGDRGGQEDKGGETDPTSNQFPVFSTARNTHRDSQS